MAQQLREGKPEHLTDVQRPPQREAAVTDLVLVKLLEADPQHRGGSLETQSQRLAALAKISANTPIEGPAIFAMRRDGRKARDHADTRELPIRRYINCVANATVDQAADTDVAPRGLTASELPLTGRPREHSDAWADCGRGARHYRAM